MKTAIIVTVSILVGFAALLRLGYVAHLAACQHALKSGAVVLTAPHRYGLCILFNAPLAAAPTVIPKLLWLGLFTTPDRVEIESLALLQTADCPKNARYFIGSLNSASDATEYVTPPRLSGISP